MCEDGFCKTFAKVFLVIVNIIFLLGGLLMLAFGIAIVVAPEKVFNLFLSSGGDPTTTGGESVETIIKACGIFMIILGAIVVVVAFFGFFGACCDSKCLLVTYAIILIIIVLAEVALIIFAAVYPRVFNESGSKALQDALKLNFKSDVNITDGKMTSGATGDSSWEALQLQFGCCGGYNYTDYTNDKLFVWTRLSCSPSPGPQCPTANITYPFPISCCTLKNGPKVTNQYSDFKDPTQCFKGVTGFYNTDGCFPAIYNSFAKYSTIAIGIAAGIVGLELILIALAFVMCCIHRKDENF